MSLNGDFTEQEHVSSKI